MRTEAVLGQVDPDSHWVSRCPRLSARNPVVVGLGARETERVALASSGPLVDLIEHMIIEQPE